MDGLKTTAEQRAQWRAWHVMSEDGPVGPMLLDDLDTALARVAGLERLVRKLEKASQLSVRDMTMYEAGLDEGRREASADNTRLRGLIGEAREALAFMKSQSPELEEILWGREPESATATVTTSLGNLRRAARVHTALSGGDADKGEA